MKTKRLFLWMYMFLFVLFLNFACEQQPQGDTSSSTTEIPKVSQIKKEDSAETILLKFVNAFFRNLPEEAYQYISAKDKAISSKEEFISDMRDAAKDPVMKVGTKNLTAAVKQITADEVNAEAIVTFTVPDLSILLSEVFSDLYTSSFTDEIAGLQLAKALEEELQKTDLPTKTFDETYTLFKENDGWKVFLDLEADKQKREKREKVRSLLAEAEDLKKQKKLHGVLEKYNEVLALDSEE